jgi:hypothetical protein
VVLSFCYCVQIKKIHKGLNAVLKVDDVIVEFE